MKENSKVFWKDMKIDTMSWKEYFEKAPLNEVIKKAVTESFKKRGY